MISRMTPIPKHWQSRFRFSSELDMRSKKDPSKKEDKLQHPSSSDCFHVNKSCNSGLLQMVRSIRSMLSQPATFSW
jgi:hypothetical protein